MKPEYEYIQGSSEKSFYVKYVNRPSRPLISNAWHYHEEIEICYTPLSTGKRFVGNDVSEYQEGDIVLLGSNLPHGFTTHQECKQLVIQFMPDFLGTQLHSIPELTDIAKLFHKAKLGLFFPDKKGKIKKRLQRVYQKNNLASLLNLIDALRLMFSSEDQQIICQKDYLDAINDRQLARMKIVYDHVGRNFMNPIPIKEVAQLINLTESAFYKFIKKKTGKSFVHIVNEFRIAHSTNLLINPEISISSACYSSGFNNLSYFTRTFKKFMHETPKQFQQRTLARYN